MRTPRKNNFKSRVKDITKITETIKRLTAWTVYFTLTYLIHAYKKKLLNIAQITKEIVAVIKTYAR